MSILGIDPMREQLGREIASRVHDGDVIGVGTGTTVDVAINAIGERIKKEKLRVSCLTTSYESAWFCTQIGITVLDNSYSEMLAWGFDGADAIDSKLRAIKGKGGALLPEKILACRCKEFVIIVDEKKCTENIAAKSIIPVEIIPSAVSIVEPKLRSLGATEITVRKSPGKRGPVITDHGNILLDVQFPSIPDSLEEDIKKITGVVESGLFLTQVSEVLIAYPDRVERRTRSRVR